MLPAPTTTATSTPRVLVALICSAIRFTSPASVPYSRSPISASPESLRRMRRNWGSEAAIARRWVARLFLPDPVIGEARDAHVLARLRGDVLAQLLDRLALVLVGVYV